jgi:hypothetical protein
MPAYFFVIVDAVGFYGPKHDFEAADDGEAVKRALDTVDGHSVELWGPRGLIGKFKCAHRKWPPRA